MGEGRALVLEVSALWGVILAIFSGEFYEMRDFFVVLLRTDIWQMYQFKKKESEHQSAYINEKKSIYMTNIITKKRILLLNLLMPDFDRLKIYEKYINNEENVLVIYWDFFLIYRGFKSFAHEKIIQFFN